MKRLDGKVAVITGAGSGIGAATARLFAHEGARLALVDIRDEAVEQVAEEIRSKGGEVYAMQADVSNSVEVSAFIERTVSMFGKLDILHANAGVLIPGSVHDLSEENWNKTLAVNLSGVFFCCKYAVPYLKNSGDGCIVITSSTAGLVAEKNIAAYCATKGGLIMLTKQMALDYARNGIRVNCLCPGWIDTPFNDPVIESPEALSASIDAWVPLGRQGLPEEVAQAVLYLASEESSLVTGHALVIDGGLTAQ